jgi:hypothetical protein
VGSFALDRIRWTTPVDLAPQFSGGDLLIHYGSPLVTPNDTVIVPVKTGASGGFRLEGHGGANGAVLWRVTTDYVLPPHGWTPSFSPVLTPGNRLYFAGAGGTLYYMDNPDASGASITAQTAFYGMGNYNHTLDSSVFIDTPITSDAAGDIFFGFQVTAANSLGLQSGIARIDANGRGTWIYASAAAGDSGISKVVQNCAPALSNDGSLLYVAVNASSGRGYLLALNSTTLLPVARAALKDVHFGTDADLPDDGTASPTVGPDGDVYFGVLENPFGSNHGRGWLLHFNSTLSQSKLAGAFGWDDTASIVPRNLVPSYRGPSPYLVLTKYNNYAGVGGDGVNRLAILDPNVSMSDPVSGSVVMDEVLTIAGVTPDREFPSLPGAVREWCINAAAVDPFSRSVLANSEDGRLYRWDLTTNTFSQSILLNNGIGEAYTPTVVGPNGTVYAIQDAVLYAIQSPATNTFLTSSLNPAGVGQPVTFTATVTAAVGGPAPPGQVTFYDRFTALATLSLSNGTTSFTTSGLSAGSHSIYAVYGGSSSGDFPFAPSYSNAISEAVRVGPGIFVLGGAPGRVQVHRVSDGGLITDFAPYGDAYFGGVSVAVGDVNGDGYLDLVTGATAGNPHVKVYDGKALATGTFNPLLPDFSLLAQFFPYALDFNVGANVAVGDVNDDGFADIVTGATAGNPDVRVYSGRDIAAGTFNPQFPDGSLLAQFFAYALDFNVGANVAAGDVNGDGFADIVTGASSGNPDVHVYNGKDIAAGIFDPYGRSLLAHWFAYGVDFDVGANVAVGDVNGDGFAEVITGASTGNPDVKVYDGLTIAYQHFASLRSEFFAYSLGFGIGATVGAGYFDGSGRMDIVTGASAGAPHYRVVHGNASGFIPPALFEGIPTDLLGGIAVGA